LGAALDLLPIGIGIFDRKLRMVYCNRPFGELRDLPPSVCRSGTALTDIIRYNAVRGDFGPGDVDEMVAARMDEITLLRPREVEGEYRDGRRLLIQYTPVPDCGLLVTYSDVTHARASSAICVKTRSAIPSSAKPSPKAFTIGRSNAMRCGCRRG
jgi:hypothetical protein